MNGNSDDDPRADAWLANWYRHPLVRRIFWFGVGGVLSIAGNYGLTQLGMRELHLSKTSAYRFGLAAMTGFTFAWSYFVNFRTSTAWHLCAGKYVVTLAGCYGISCLLGPIGFRLLPTQTALVIAGVQIGVAFLKFGIFHFWVFPRDLPGEAKELEVAENR